MTPERDVDSLSRLREFFTADRFALRAGAVIDSSDDSGVTCSMPVTPDILNGAGSVQGGAVFTLADFAFAVHSNRDYVLRGAPEPMRLAQSAQIVFLKRTRGARLFAASRLVSGGRRVSVYQVGVTDDLGEDIALFTVNAYALDRA